MIELGLGAWHQRLFESLLFVLVAGIIFSLLKAFRNKNIQDKRRETLFGWLFTLGNAILLTLFTIGCSGQYPLLLEEQVSLFSELHRFKSQLHRNQTPDVLLDRNRLLLVDVSHDLALIPDPSLNETWKSNQLITDRQKLTRFLESLNSETDSATIDLVVCDLVFSEFSPDSTQDKALEAALRALDKKGKLLMARSELKENKTAFGTSAIRSDLMKGGSVDIRKYYDETFFSYRPLVKDAGIVKASLPYILYTKLTRFERPRNPYCLSKPFVNKQVSKDPDVFVPDFWIDNEDVSRAAEFETDNPWWLRPFIWLQELCSKSNNEPAKPQFGNVSSRLRNRFFYLGQVTDTDTSAFNGRSLFVDQLLDNYKECKRNIVFIGIFEDPERDMHETLVGPMHGSVLLINLLLNLLAGSHQIGWGYVVYLLIGFGLVSFLLLPNHPPEGSEETAELTEKLKFTDLLGEKLHEIVEKIAEKRAYIVAFVVLLGAITFFNHLINLAVIGVYLAVTYEVFKYLFPREFSNKPKPEPPEDNMHS